jgi:urea carboxylase-associated protein 2
MTKDKILFQDSIPGGWNWSHVLKKGTSLRLMDTEGGVNVSMLLFNPLFPAERYNLADTLKAQYISYYTKGNVLYSDMGRILLSVIDDSVGWHDAIGGLTNAKSAMEKYGNKTYEEHHNAYIRNGKDSLLTEIMKYGFSLRDLTSNINWFSKVDIDKDGNTSFIPGHSKAGDYVDLQAEMDTLVVLNTCPHPLDPKPEYAPKPLGISVWASRPGPGG